MKCPRMQVCLIGPGSLCLNSDPVHVALLIAGVAAGVGSAVAVLLLAFIILISVATSIMVVKSCKKKGECHFEMTGLYSGNTIIICVILLTANNDPEEPYYSTVYTGQPIAMKENDAYGCPPPARQEINVEENPAYRVTGQSGTTNRQIKA